MKYDVVTVGSAILDAFMKTDNSQAELLDLHGHTDICYISGAKILVSELTFFTGGGGTNTAVAFARMGFNTAYLGNIGRDEHGNIIMKELLGENVAFIGTRGGKTGFSVVINPVKDDRTIFTFKGACDTLSLPDNKIKEIDTSWFYFSSMKDKGMDFQIKLCKYAKKKGIKICYNPSLYIAKMGLDKVSKILKNVDVLIYNKEEARAMLNSNTDNIYELLEKSAALGPKIVAITDGRNGSHCFDGKSFYSAKPLKVKVVETTGAGDAFASGFIAGLLKQRDINQCLIIGMLNAESVIQYKGSKNVLLGSEIFDKSLKDKRQVVIKTINI